MRKTDKIYIALVVFMVILFDLFIYKFNVTRYYEEQKVTCNVTMSADQLNTYTVYYNRADDFTNIAYTDDQSASAKLQETEAQQVLKFDFEAASNIFRLDPGVDASSLKIYDVVFSYKGRSIRVSPEYLSKSFLFANQITSCDLQQDGSMQIEAQSGDPYVTFGITDFNLVNMVRDADRNLYRCIKIALCLLIVVIGAVLIKIRRDVIEIVKDFIKSRKLLWSLSKNDFKTKYAGSYLGIVWAFIQPIVTVCVYWFVFSVGLRAGSPSTVVPYAHWMVCGLVPWFFFSDALMGGTNALLEYSYLVKKIVFKIDILPAVKIISAVFVHLFFILFMLIMYAGSGFYPDWYVLQLLYYSLCTFILVLALSYMTCAIVVFFRDLTQIINIVLQVGIWMTPIMWNINIIPKSLVWIFQLNPLMYVVQGYRDSMIDKISIAQRAGQGLYFWCVVLAILYIGFRLFRKLEVHFADVL